MLAGCNAHLGRSNFDELMQREVGKSLDDPDSYRARNPQLRLGARKLPNGNTEEEFLAGFRDACHVFFEVGKDAGKVVNWRIGLPDDDCILTAPLVPPADKK